MASLPDRGWQSTDGLLTLHSFLSLQISNVFDPCSNEKLMCVENDGVCGFSTSSAPLARCLAPQKPGGPPECAGAFLDSVNCLATTFPVRSTVVSHLTLILSPITRVHIRACSIPLGSLGADNPPTAIPLRDQSARAALPTLSTSLWY